MKQEKFLKADKAGRTIGVGIGAGLILAGAAGLFIGTLPWAAGTAAAGGINIVSNMIYNRNSSDGGK